MKPKTTAFRRYIVIPFAFASIAAATVASIGVITNMTGYQGRYQTSGTPISFAESWTNVPEMMGLIFVVTFLALVVWTRVRLARTDDK